MSIPLPPSEESPLAVFYGGTNGSGKSTLRGQYQDATIELHIDPDSIAKTLSQDDPRFIDQRAGRKAIEFFKFAIDVRQPFSMESTLTGKSIVKRMQEAKEAGFNIELRYVGLESADLNVQRVAERVAKGGHNIEEHVIRRRYEDSRENLAAATKIANRVVIWDNSDPEPKLCATITEGVLEVRDGAKLPGWIADVIHQISPSLSNSPVDLQKLLGAPLTTGSFSDAVKRIETYKSNDKGTDREP
ncbi:zeta toxin family protein [Pseudomonas sp. CFBP 13719]|uniref:zeta toxin family protein n=1 Tax=Pseudomonas sp. CFBP 13719 TaxID=2775303 RepID=UPI00177A82EE|nr:zeta toxin family protein [Pseudomonas sp. CFBP 13719]MBD8614966.1 zeta toxin family protein [Pseudomonas putida]MBD8681351.1 zeta toxin family protein [Pseudomonas sp. CFBP 13719]